MDKEVFINYCAAELRTGSENNKAGKPNDKQKLRTKELLQAARLLELISVDDISNMREQEH